MGTSKTFSILEKRGGGGVVGQGGERELVEVQKERAHQNALAIVAEKRTGGEEKGSEFRLLRKERYVRLFREKRRKLIREEGRKNDRSTSNGKERKKRPTFFHM